MTIMMMNILILMPIIIVLVMVMVMVISMDMTFLEIPTYAKKQQCNNLSWAESGDIEILLGGDYAKYGTSDPPRELQAIARP